MRSFVCSLALFGFGVIVFFCFIALALPRPLLSALIVASLLISSVVTFIQFRFIEQCASSKFQVTIATALIIISFVACWQILWAASEELLIRLSISSGQVGDDGARWLYPGMSGMGNADGFLRPSKMIKTVMFFGGTGAVIFSLPFTWLLTAYKKQSEQVVAPDGE